LLLGDILAVRYTVEQNCVKCRVIQRSEGIKHVQTQGNLFEWWKDEIFALLHGILAGELCEWFCQWVADANCTTGNSQWIFWWWLLLWYMIYLCMVFTK